MTTQVKASCPNHPGMGEQVLDPKDGFKECGCWEKDGKLIKHAFRFWPGDRVQFGRFAGITGTVAEWSHNSSRPSVTWDSHCKGWAVSRPSNFEIRRVGE